MMSQNRFILERTKESGGKENRTVKWGGHPCFSRSSGASDLVSRARIGRPNDRQSANRPRPGP